MMSPKGGISMEQDSFAGYNKHKNINIIESGGIKSVLVNGQPYMSWQCGDDASERMAIVQLYKSGLSTQEELARLFDLHINSVQKYVADFANEGLQGLVAQRSGPRQRWKITPCLRAKILFIALKEGILEYESIQKRLEQWNVHMSLMSIRQVLLENGFVKEKIIVPDIEVKQRELFDREGEEQLQLKLGCNPEPEKLILEEGKEKEVEDREVNNCSGVEIRYKRNYSRSQRSYLDQLEQGYYNAYAGGVLFVSLLEQYCFLPTLKRVINIPTYEGYSLEELCLTLLYFDVFGFRSMEDFKTVYPEEFGMLIGRSYGPSLYTLRRFLHKVRKLDKSEMLIDEFAFTYLKTGIAKWGVLYIDGHFLPYYGIYPISKGWHGVRRIPMKGSYNFIGVDDRFNPWIFLIRSSSEDLLQKIPEIIERVKKIGHRIGLSLEEIENLIVIFDREGYSAELYRFLDGRDREDGKRRAIFISWAKYSDKWVNEVAEEKFDRSVVVTYEIQEFEEIKYFQAERVMNKYGKIRTIVVLSMKNKKRAAIYTNGKDNEINAEKIVQLICRRWGQENLIKELLIKHLINYSPGYVIEQMEEQPMVDNPKVKELKKERASRASELHKLKVQLADKILKDSQEGMNWEDIKRNHIQPESCVNSVPKSFFSRSNPYYTRCLFFK